MVTLNRTEAPAKPTGVSASSDYGIAKVWNEESGSLVDRTSEVTGGAGVTIFSNNEDYIYIGIKPEYAVKTTEDCNFVDLHIKLDINASEDINQTIEYWDKTTEQWETLPIDTDGTNGFTQDGSITFDRENFPFTNYRSPSYSENNWGVKQVEDATDRYYLRIKRNNANSITAPKISEVGTGILTANTTYYYRVASYDNTGELGYRYRAPRRSEPSDEVTATTTDVKRCIKIEWTYDTGNVTSYIVWRAPNQTYTPDPWEYSVERTSVIDTYLQNVNGMYLGGSEGAGAIRRTMPEYQADNYTIDRGSPCGYMNYRPENSVDPSDNVRGLCTLYITAEYSPKARHKVTISGGTSDDPYSLKDVYEEYQTNGWDTIELLSKDGEDNIIYYNYDNLVFEGYFKDDTLTLKSRGYIDASGVTSFQLGETTGANISYKAPKIIFVGRAPNTYAYYINNATLSAVTIQDDVLTPLYPGRSYIRWIIQDDVTMSDCIVESRNRLQAFELNGSNISISEGVFTNLRFGLQPSDTAVDTLSIIGTKLQATGSQPGLDVSEIPDGEERTYTNINFNCAYRPVRQWVGVDPDAVGVNLINPTIASGSVGLDGSEMNEDSYINEKYNVDITVIDSTGTAVENATVTITNTNGTQVYSGSTDASGQISTTITTKKYTANPDNPGSEKSTFKTDDITNYNPFTIRISKTGKDTEVIIDDIESNIDCPVSMQDKQLIYAQIESNINEDSFNSSITEDTISSNITDDEIESNIVDDNISSSYSDDNTTGDIT